MSTLPVELCRLLGLTKLAAKLGARSSTIPDAVAIRLPTDLGGRTIRMYTNADPTSPAANLWRTGWTGQTASALALYASCCPGVQTVLDASPRGGLFSIIPALCSDAIVHALEPDRAAASGLRANLILSGVGGRTMMCEATPADRTIAASDGRPATTTLDDYRRTHVTSRIGLIHLDAPGLEPAILSAATNTLSTDRPFIFLPLSPATPVDALSDALTHADYRTAAVRDAALEFVESPLYDPAAPIQVLYPRLRMEELRASARRIRLELI